MMIIEKNYPYSFLVLNGNVGQVGNPLVKGEFKVTCNGKTITIPLSALLSMPVFLILLKKAWLNNNSMVVECIMVGNIILKSCCN